ncbi:MAG: hypothetical protein AAF411_11480 [Myxococcota bacterium]
MVRILGYGVLLTASLLGGSRSASAQGTFPGAVAMGEALAVASVRRWEGTRAPRREAHERPPTAQRTCAGDVCIHGPAALRDQTRPLAEAGAAFIRFLDRASFRSAPADGGRGGDDRLDIYLSPATNGVAAFMDAENAVRYHDSALTFGVADPRTCGAGLERCVLQAVAQARLLAMLPDEGDGWHEALSAWLLWRYTGRFGAHDEDMQAQFAPRFAPVERARSHSGSLLLAYVDARMGGDGRFIREVCELARQRTWDDADYRGSPDLWQALAVALDRGGERLHSILEDAAADRARMMLGSPSAVLPGVAPGAGPLAIVDGAELPAHTPPGPELGPFASSFALVDLGESAREGRRLRVWLRGEYGVEWSLTAIRLGADGEDLGRLSAPPRRGDGRSYLPVEIGPETARVLVAVTNLSHRLPDADEPFDPNGRAFRMIYDFADDLADDDGDEGRP